MPLLDDTDRNVVTDNLEVRNMDRPVAKYDYRNSAFADPTHCRIGEYGPEHRRRFYEEERRRRRALRKQIFCGFMNLIFIQPFIFLYYLVMRKKRER